MRPLAQAILVNLVMVGGLAYEFHSGAARIPLVLSGILLLLLVNVSLAAKRKSNKPARPPREP